MLFTGVLSPGLPSPVVWFLPVCALVEPVRTWPPCATRCVAALQAKCDTSGWRTKDNFCVQKKCAAIAASSFGTGVVRGGNDPCTLGLVLRTVRTHYVGICVVLGIRLLMFVGDDVVMYMQLFPSRKTTINV